MFGGRVCPLSTHREPTTTTRNPPRTHHDKLVQACTSLYKLVQACTSLSWWVRGGLRVVVVGSRWVDSGHTLPPNTFPKFPMFVYLYIRLSVCMFVRSYIRPHISVFQSVCSSVHIYVCRSLGQLIRQDCGQHADVCTYVMTPPSTFLRRQTFSQRGRTFSPGLAMNGVRRSLNAVRCSAFCSDIYFVR